MFDSLFNLYSTNAVKKFAIGCFIVGLLLKLLTNG